MRNKYLILDETNLEILKTESGVVRLFEFKDMAVVWAKNNCLSWQVIEVPFGDE